MPPFTCFTRETPTFGTAVDLIVFRELVLFFFACLLLRVLFRSVCLGMTSRLTATAGDRYGSAKKIFITGPGRPESLTEGERDEELEQSIRESRACISSFLSSIFFFVANELFRRVTFAAFAGNDDAACQSYFSSES